jgi:hypothetical protein
VNAAKSVVGHGEIRIEGQRVLCLGFRPIEVLFVYCGPRRYKSRQRFFRILFDRLFRVSLAELQRAFRVIASTILVVEHVRHT